jgi:hypothetical protein
MFLNRFLGPSQACLGFPLFRFVVSESDTTNLNNGNPKQEFAS